MHFPQRTALLLVILATTTNLSSAANEQQPPAVVDEAVSEARTAMNRMEFCYIGDRAYSEGYRADGIICDHAISGDGFNRAEQPLKWRRIRSDD